MLRGLRENLALKLLALVTAIMIWSYAATERAGSPTRQVLAEVVAVGQPPPGLTVELGSTSVPVEVAGPRQHLDAIADGSVKAVVELGSARPGARLLRVARFVAPREAPGVTFPPQTRAVAATVRTTARKRVRIAPDFSQDAPSGQRYALTRVEPGWADVEGPRDAVERVSALVVRPDVRLSGYSGQVIVDPLDAGGLAVEGVRVAPPNAYVEIGLQPLSEAKTLVVSPAIRGKPAPPYVIVAVACDPATVTVTGGGADLSRLRGISTKSIDIEGLRADAVRQVALDLPSGVHVAEMHRVVSVSISVHDASRTQP